MRPHMSSFTPRSAGAEQEVCVCFVTANRSHVKKYFEENLLMTSAVHRKASEFSRRNEMKVLLKGEKMGIYQTVDLC